MKEIKNTKGFTLIELIVIIVVLGLLAAVAVTRYQDLTSDAMISTSKGNLGSIRSGIKILHAKVLLAGVSASNPEWPTLAELNANITSGRTPASLNNLKMIEGPSGGSCQAANVCMPEDLVSTLATVGARSTVMGASTAQANSRTPPGGSGGWAYDENTGQFYVNQANPVDSRGIPANQW
ncbi:MAG TPA: prepilin-type N-terminal cleavage/methylation domain-containing protein [Nitrospiria bacterium]